MIELMLTQTIRRTSACGIDIENYSFIDRGTIVFVIGCTNEKLFKIENNSFDDYVMILYQGHVYEILRNAVQDAPFISLDAYNEIYRKLFHGYNASMG